MQSAITNLSFNVMILDLSTRSKEPPPMDSVMADVTACVLGKELRCCG